MDIKDKFFRNRSHSFVSSQLSSKGVSQSSPANHSFFINILEITTIGDKTPNGSNNLDASERIFRLVNGSGEEGKLDEKVNLSAM